VNVSSSTPCFRQRHPWGTPRFLVHRVAGTDDFRLVTDREFELARKHVGELLVRMRVHRSDGSSLEIHFDLHQPAVVGENSPGYAAAQVLEVPVLCVNEHR
jgi:hypothetical protein